MNRTGLATAGLFAAWALHDAEEWVSMAPTSQQTLSRLPRVLPIPEELRAQGISQEQVNAALAMMAVVMGAAAAEGYRTGGRSWFFQNVLHVYGLHGFSHLAACAATRGYASGAATSPVFVIPFWWWARRELRRNGVPDKARTVSYAAFPVLGFAVHSVARRLSGTP